MNVKEYLGQLERLEILIEQKKEELKRLRELSASVGSPTLSVDKVKSGSTPKGAGFEKNIEKCMLLEEEIRQEIAAFTDKRHTIINQIQGLGNAKYINVLYKRYIMFEQFEDIAADMNYSISNIYIVHKKALKEFQKKYFDETL